MKKETLLAVLGEVLDEVKIMEADVAFEHGDGCEHNAASARLATIIKVAEMETIEDSPKIDLNPHSSDFVASDDKIPTAMTTARKKASNSDLNKAFQVWGDNGKYNGVVFMFGGEPIFHYGCVLTENVRKGGEPKVFIGTNSMFQKHKKEVEKATGMLLCDITSSFATAEEADACIKRYNTKGLKGLMEGEVNEWTIDTSTH